MFSRAPAVINVDVCAAIYGTLGRQVGNSHCPRSLAILHRPSAEVRAEDLRLLMRSIPVVQKRDLRGANEAALARLGSLGTAMPSA